MPYSHQWRRVPILSRMGFAKAAEDIKIILEHVAKMGVRVAGPLGYGKPEIGEGTIAFNGSKECGHRFRNYGEPWPTDAAEGVFEDNPVAEVPYWSGEHMTTRMCHGDDHCAAAPFVIDRVFMEQHWTRLEHGGYFCKCVTLFKPYDLVVTASLIRFKEHLSDEIFINSDGHEKAFEDARRLCRELFGFTRNFQIEPVESELV